MVRLFVGLLLAVLAFVPPVIAQASKDWVTGFPREQIAVKTWPEGRKVAVCFVFYVEVWGKDHGPNFRPDMTDRKPDVVDESFRQYAIEWGVPRVGRLFKEQDAPLSIALNAQFPEQHPEIWKQFRALVPRAAIVAHGINNSTEMLPLDVPLGFLGETLDGSGGFMPCAPEADNFLTFFAAATAPASRRSSP